MAAKKSFKEILEDYQIKIMKQSLKEAELKSEKAQVELETAKMQQRHLQQLIMKELPKGETLQ